MKLAIVSDVIHPYSKGGREERTRQISKRLVERGHEVHIYTMNWWGAPSTKMDGNVHLHGVCDVMSLYTPDGRGSIKEARRFARGVSRHLKKERFDVIDCDEFPFFPCLSAKRASGSTPLVITWLEVWDDYWYEYLGRVRGFIGKIIEKRVVGLPNHLIAISNKVKKDLTTRLRVDESRITVVPAGGVDLGDIEKVRAYKEEFDVVYVGRLVDHKKIDVLIRAIAKIAKTREIRAGIVGDGSKRNELEKLVKKLGLDKTVKFLGGLEDHSEVLSVMKSSKIFVNPSIREGFGITFIEAMASGCPVIGVRSPHNTTQELIKSGYNGLVSDLTPSDLSHNILRLLNNSNLMEELSQNAISFAKNFSWDEITDKVENVYQNTMSKG